MIRLAVRCRPEQANAVLAELAALAPNGFEEEQGADYVEYAVYGAEGELPDLGSLAAVSDQGTVQIAAAEVPDDWADRWQDFHQPLLVGEELWVRPSWAQPHPEAIDLVVDPGRAFGTGAHSTTRMCLEMLVEEARSGRAGGALADLGTGSGLLAIAAAKLGWEPVLACDHEPAAIEAAAANAAVNGIGLQLQRLNLRREPPPLAPTVVANLTAPLLREVAERCEAPPVERLLCSGVLPSEADEVAQAFGRAGLAECARRSKDCWVALLLASDDGGENHDG